MADWADLDWSHRGVVEFDQTYIDEAVPVVPVYLSGFDATWWANVDSAGDDIRVYQEDGTTLLDYYLVSIDGILDEGLILVNVDGYISASTNKKIYVYCGNSGASAGSDAAATFADYAAYYLPGMTTSNLANPGTYDLTAVNTPGTTASGIEGLTAATYNGTDEYHKYEGTPSPSNWPITIGALCSSSSSTTLQMVAGLGATASGNNVYLRFDGRLASKIFSAFFSGATSSSTVSSTATYSTSTNYFLAATRDASSGTSRLYIDGGADGTETTTIGTPTFNRISIGARFNFSTSPSFYHSGSVSYVEFSAEARSANYFSTMYDAWFTSAFRTYGPTDTAPTSNDTGWIPFTNTSQTAATAIWNNLSNAIGSLVDSTLSQPDEDELTYTLRAKNDNGLGDVISGTVDDLWYRVVGESDTGGSEQIDCTTARMVIGGSASGNNFAASFEFGTKKDKVWKHSVDNFGTLPTPAQIQDGDNFGIDLQFTNEGTTVSDIRIYTVEFRAFFTPPAAGNPSGMFPIL